MISLLVVIQRDCMCEGMGVFDVKVISSYHERDVMVIMQTMWFMQRNVGRVCEAMLELLRREYGAYYKGNTEVITKNNKYSCKTT